MPNGRPSDRPAGLAQTIPVGRQLLVGTQQITVRQACSDVAELDVDGVIHIVDAGHGITINTDTRVWVGWARQGSARLAIDAPRTTPITRPVPPANIP